MRGNTTAKLTVLRVSRLLAAERADVVDGVVADCLVGVAGDGVAGKDGGRRAQSQETLRDTIRRMIEQKLMRWSNTRAPQPHSHDTSPCTQQHTHITAHPNSRGRGGRPSAWQDRKRRKRAKEASKIESDWWATVSHSLTGRCTRDRGCGGVRAARSCLLYTSPSPRDGLLSRMPSSA